jgi:nucleotide-binding universal stress UspA family protein
MHVADPRLLLGDLPLHESAEATMDAQVAAGQRLVEALVAQAAAAGVACDGVVRRDPPQRVADLVLREVGEWDADVLVIGSHGRQGLARLVLGSEAEAVLRRCGVPVLVVRDPAPGVAA